MKMLYPALLAINTLFFVSSVEAQKTYGTRNGQIVFQSPSDEDVKAINNEVSSRLQDNGAQVLVY